MRDIIKGILQPIIWLVLILLAIFLVAWIVSLATMSDETKIAFNIYATFYGKFDALVLHFQTFTEHILEGIKTMF